MLLSIGPGIAVPEMYDIFLLLLWLLFSLALRWVGPVTELSVVDQLKRKIGSLEKETSELIQQVADCRARTRNSEARPAMLIEAAAQVYKNRDQQYCAEQEDTSSVLKVRTYDKEEVKLLNICRSMVLENLSGAIGFAERRNAAVSKLYFDLFGETNGNVQLLSQLTDPWRKWAELLATERSHAEQMFTQCLERASHNNIDLEELALSTDLQYHPWPELDYGFDRILDLVRLRLSLPLSRPETATDHEFLCGARKMFRASTRRGGSGAGAGRSNSISGVVHKPGCRRLPRALHNDTPDVPEEQTYLNQDGSIV